MTVSEFVKFWDTVNKTKYDCLYFYKDKAIYTYQLNAITTPLTSIKIDFVQVPIDSNDVSIYSVTYDKLSYTQDQFLKTLKTELPLGTFTYKIHIYIN